MNYLRKLDNWIDWRGTNWGEIACASIALGTIVSLSLMLIVSNLH